MRTPYLLFTHCWITAAASAGKSWRSWRFCRKIGHSDVGHRKADADIGDIGQSEELLPLPEQG
jgi:hypothetical protein